MPVLLLFLGILAVHSLSLPEAEKGVAWLLKPDFSRIDIQVALDALGHTFFAVGIGVSTAFVFGSYLNEQSNIIADALIIIAINAAVAVLAGLAIFPAMYTFGLTKAAGTGLVFETMPAVFAHLPGGWFLSAGFFFLLIISGFASGLGLVEGVVGTLDEAWKLGRNKTLFLVLAAVFAAKPSRRCSPTEPMPRGRLFRLWDRSIFVFAEYVVTALLMPVGALLMSVFVAWKFGFSRFAEEANQGALGGCRCHSETGNHLSWPVVPCAVGTILLLGILISL